VCEHFDFPKVGKNIYSRGTATDWETEDVWSETAKCVWGEISKWNECPSAGFIIIIIIIIIMFRGAKRPGCGVDHRPQSSAECKEMVEYTSTTPLGLHGRLYGELYLVIIIIIIIASVCNDFYRIISW
jgi:uncharacterized membrane protein